MSRYLYFPNNLKDIKDHIWLMIVTMIMMIMMKNPSQINGNSFQRKTKLIFSSYILK